MLQGNLLILAEVTLSLPTVTLQPMREDRKRLATRFHALNREWNILRLGELTERTVIVPYVV
jgi:hypothetical protein